MTIPEPSGPLWTEVKARYDPWPPDDEVVAQQLGTAWRGAAGAVNDASAQVTTSGQAAHASWQDTGGDAMGAGAAAIGTTFEQLGQQQLQQAALAEDYATSLIRAKQGIHDVIAEYSTGLHLNGTINQPSAEDPLIDLEAQAGVQVTGPKLEQPLGPVTISAQPEFYVGPGAKFSFDPNYENGKFSLGLKIGASPFIGGGLNGGVTLDFPEIYRSLFPS
ncbi:WXG100-like domain-containing protein [Saccharothrix deserti]|uniref:WXG100-like domain-containing protein n=1 Tax=Saccharothrix deserti TaxID=2593674 RepID=UPI00131BE187|nr:hypothetical protein [Saccharothrix deserti]